MTTLLLAVTEQTRFVCAVHSFIRDLLLLMMPDLLDGNGYVRSDTEFWNRMDDALVRVDSKTADKTDYIHAIVNAACDEMEKICRLLRAACCLVGFDVVAAEYLDAKRFKEMLLRKDGAKLERLLAIMRTKNGKPVKILMDIAAVLNERTANYDEMDAAAKRKANADFGRIVAKVENIISGVDSLHRKLDEDTEKVMAHVDAVGAKVDRLKFKGKRKSRHSEEQRRVCFTCWNAAQRNTELKYSTNRGVTYAAAFSYYKGELAKVNITKLGKFVAVLHSMQSLEYAQRKRELEAKREAERKAKKKSAPRPRRR